MSTRLIIVVAAFIFSTSLSFSQTIDTARLDSLFNNLEKHDLAIGSVAISQSGKIIYQRSFGKDQTSQTEYRIGSITKVFTAILIYQAIDAGKLSLKDHLDKFFPDLPNAGQITIAQLLGHRSGLANFTTSNTKFDDWKDQPKTHEQLLGMIKDQPPDFMPDAKADYNNSNFLLLGYILEKINNKTYNTLVTERIIKKAGLSHTYYGTKVGFQPGEAISYKYFNSEWRKDKAVYLDNFAGAGAIISTPQDLSQLISRLFGGQLISRSSLDTMKSIRKDGYGMGLFPYGDEKHPGFGHNGKTESFASSLQYYPETKLAIAYCTNGEIYPKAAILDDICSICFNRPVSIPTFEPITMSAQTLQTYLGTYADPKIGIQALTTIDSNQLTLTTKGQPFKLIAISINEFWNKPFGFFFEFSADGKKLIIKDGDNEYQLTKTPG